MPKPARNLTPSRRVLVTGAGRGLGFALTRALAWRGWEVLAGYRDEGAAKRLAALTGPVRMIRLDVTCQADIDRLAASVIGTQPLDGLILNAGIPGSVCPIEKTESAEVERVLAVNSVAPLILLSRLSPALERAGSAKVFAMSSRLASLSELTEGSRGFRLRGGYYSYRMSKAALNMLVRAAAVELSDRGICIVALAPGWIRTEMGGQEAPDLPEPAAEKIAALLERLPMTFSGCFLDLDGAPIGW